MIPIDVITAGWYNFFYVLAVAVGAAALYRGGRERGWGSGRWTIAVAAWVTGGVLGSLLPYLIIGDLAAPRTAIGAVAGATIALALTSRCFGFRAADALDASAIAIPLGAAVARLGCFLADCCRGVELHGTGGARHPVQLYESALEAILAVAVSRRARASKPGEAIVSSIGWMCAIRFVTEFVRDNEKFGSFSLAQWIVLPVGLACVGLTLGRTNARADAPIAAPSLSAATGLAIFMGGAIAFTSLQLPALESAALYLALCAVVIAAFRRARLAAPAGATVLALQVPALPVTTDTGRIFFVGGGYAAGSFHNRHIASDCDGKTEEWSRGSSFAGFAAEAGTRNQKTATRANALRVRAYLGQIRVGAATVVLGAPRRPEAHTLRQGGVSLILDSDWRYIGLSTGVSVGSFYPAGHEPESGPALERPINGIPAFGLRVGPRVGLSGELRYGDESPSWSPGHTSVAALSLAGRSGNRLRLGASEVGPFISGNIRTHGGLEIQPSIVVGPKSDYGVGDFRMGSVTIRKWFRDD